LKLKFLSCETKHPARKFGKLSHYRSIVDTLAAEYCLLLPIPTQRKAEKLAGTAACSFFWCLKLGILWIRVLSKTGKLACLDKVS
jgi:hypothetical protein